MRISPAAVKGCFPALLLSLPGMVVSLPERGAAAPTPEAVTVRLTNQVEISVPGVEIDHAALLPDNETVVVVGGKPKPGDLDDKDWIIADAPAAGALVNLKTKKVRPFTNGHTARIKNVAVSLEGPQVVTVSHQKDPFVSIWDVKADKLLKLVQIPKFEEQKGPYHVACFTGSKKIALPLDDNIALVDLSGGEKRIDLSDASLSDDAPGKLAISPEDKLVACATLFGRVLVWDVKREKVVCSASLLPEGANYRDWLIHSIGFSKDGTHLIASRSGKEDEVPKGTAEEKVKPERRALFLIDIAKQQVTPLGMGHQIHTNSFALHPTEDWLATMGASRPDHPDKKGLTLLVAELRVYHFPTRTLAFRVQFDEFFPWWVGFTPDGKKLVAVDRKGKVRVWDFMVTKR